MLLKDIVNENTAPTTSTLANELLELKTQYLKMIADVCPDSVLSENVEDVTAAFKNLIEDRPGMADEMTRDMADEENKKYDAKKEKENDPKGREKEKYGTDKIASGIDGIVKRFQAAKKGIGIVNKMKGEDRKKHARRVMQNMNALRSSLTDLESMIQKAFVKG